MFGASGVIAIVKSFCNEPRAAAVIGPDVFSDLITAKKGRIYSNGSTLSRRTLPDTINIPQSMKSTPD